MAMTTRDKLRMRIGDSNIPYVFTDDELDYILADYEGATEKITILQSAIIAFNILLANASKLFNYKEASSSVNKSDIFNHIKDMITVLSKELVTESGSNSPLVKKRTTKYDEEPYNEDFCEESTTDLTRNMEGGL